MVIALTIASWFTTARIVRGQVITLKQNDYVRAAHAVGRALAPSARRAICFRTRSACSSSSSSSSSPNVVLGEAFLSFIGLGINPPDASWGSLASDGRDAYRTHPLDLWIPCLFIAALVLCANFIADGLRDALDPRTRET